MKYIKLFEECVHENFHSDIKKYEKESGNSLKDVNMKKDLINLSKKMKKFTEEEAIVQLLSKYKRQNYDTSLLLKFRNEYKDTLRWIRDDKFIIDPQDFIDYNQKTIKKLVLSNPQKNHIAKTKKQ